MENVDSKIDKILSGNTPRTVPQRAGVPQRADRTYGTYRTEQTKQPTVPPKVKLAAQDCSFYEAYDYGR